MHGSGKQGETRPIGSWKRRYAFGAAIALIEVMPATGREAVEWRL